MRDLFDDMFQGEPRNPTAAARRAMKPQLRQRFYGTAGVAEQAGGFAVVLDGRAVRTPARPACGADATLAQALADEWDAQREVIDPAVPLTRLANAIIDGVADAPDRVAGKSRTISVPTLSSTARRRARRAGGAAAQHWDPVVAWARDVLGARFVLAEGIALRGAAGAALARAADPARSRPKSCGGWVRSIPSLR